MPPRYAIYYVPEESDRLWSLGCAFLGSALTGEKEIPQPKIGTLAAKEVYELTSEPRRYGLHATLKAPFELQRSLNERALFQAMSTFAAGHSCLAVPPLTVSCIGAFLALAPDTAHPPLNALGNACVEAFDEFRKPESAEQQAARTEKGLSPRQSDYLSRWGYPYVFEEYRFHITLTNSIAEQEKLVAMQSFLNAYLEPALGHEVRISEICLCKQQERHLPFVLLNRFPLQ